MAVLKKFFNELLNPIREILIKQGWEEPVDPSGPVMGPIPNPWREAVPQLVQAAIAKDIATRIKSQDGIHSATLAIDAIIDDYCGTRPRKLPRKWHWPWPGPPPWTWEIASQLSLVANSLHAGSLRIEIEAIVTKIASHGNSAVRSE